MEFSEGERAKAKGNRQRKRSSHTRTLIDGFLKHDIPPKVWCLRYHPLWKQYPYQGGMQPAFLQYFNGL